MAVDDTESQPETRESERVNHALWTGTGKGGKGREYTEQDRLTALSIYAETGNGKLASRQTGIPPSTVAGWVRAAESDNTLDRLRAAVRYRLAHDYVDIACRAVDVLRQRLDTGDPHVLRDGRIIYRPILARDAVMIASICTDKHALITGQLQGSRQVDRSLSHLADELVRAMRQARGRSDPVTVEQAEQAAGPGDGAQDAAVSGGTDRDGGKARA